MQNKLHAATAHQVIFQKMSPQQRKEKIQELAAQGYEYNEHIDILLKQDKELPYDFILFCFLVRDSYRRA